MPPPQPYQPFAFLSPNFLPLKFTPLKCTIIILSLIFPFLQLLSITFLLDIQRKLCLWLTSEWFLASGIHFFFFSLVIWEEGLKAW